MDKYIFEEDDIEIREIYEIDCPNCYAPISSPYLDEYECDHCGSRVNIIHIRQRRGQ